VKGIECSSSGCDYVKHTPDPSAWPKATKRLLDEEGFRFDYTREQLAVQVDGRVFNLFGGDGAPLYNPEGMASVRLFRQRDDGIPLIVQIACQYKSADGVDAGHLAAAAAKAFYDLFDVSPLEVCQKYGAVFGQA
jgi:hypothetical protein